MEDSRQRGHWERVRTLAAICIQPHVRKKITPWRLIPLPWDNAAPKPDTAPELSRADREQRYRDLLRRLGRK